MTKTKAKKKIVSTFQLREDFVRGSKPSSVDAQAGTIKGVKILGLISENNRRYTREALKKALRLYEGRHVNVDHPSRPSDQRSAHDRFGKLVNVQFRDGSDDEAGLFGDLILLRSHSLAKTVLEAAERMPDAFGLSHNADGKGFRDAEGVYVVEEITDVRSVDLVADPATNKSLFESRAMKTKSLKQLIEGNEKIAIVTKTALLEADDDMLAAEPVADKGDDWKQSLIDACGVLVQSDDPEKHDTAKKILSILKPAATPEAEDDEEEETTEAEDDDEKDEKTESAKGKKPAKGTEALTEAKAKQLCKLAGVAEDKVLIETLTSLDEDKALAHLDYLKGLASKKAKGPKSQSPGGAPAAGESLFEGKSLAPKEFVNAITD